MNQQYVFDKKEYLNIYNELQFMIKVCNDSKPLIMEYEQEMASYKLKENYLIINNSLKTLAKVLEQP